MTSSPAVDGRSARAQRTRDSVVDAVLTLAANGNPRPTAREIAEEAGISVRSVYVHFDDLDDLFRAAADRHFQHSADLLTPVDATLAQPMRISASVDQRIAIYENGREIRRAAEQWAPQSPALAELLREGRKVGARDTERLFGPDLTGRPDRDITISALSILLSAEAWDGLRAQGLSVDASREVLTHAMTRLLVD